MLLLGPDFKFQCYHCNLPARFPNILQRWLSSEQPRFDFCIQIAPPDLRLLINPSKKLWTRSFWFYLSWILHPFYPLHCALCSLFNFSSRRDSSLSLLLLQYSPLDLWTFRMPNTRWTWANRNEMNIICLCKYLREDESSEHKLLIKYPTLGANIKYRTSLMKAYLNHPPMAKLRRRKCQNHHHRQNRNHPIHQDRDHCHLIFCWSHFDHVTIWQFTIQYFFIKPLHMFSLLIRPRT